MSVKDIQFAIQQKQLKPTEQLALIIICNEHPEYFIKEDAINTVFIRTSLTERQAINAVNGLCKKEIIRASSFKKLAESPTQPAYFIPVYDL